MKKLCFLFIILLMTIPIYSQSWSWTKSLGDVGTDEIEHLAVDNNQNILCAGKFSGNVWLGNDYIYSYGLKDVLVAKYSASGTLLWAKGAGGLGTDEGLGIATDPNDNVFVTGFYQDAAVFDSTLLTGIGGDEMFIAKYDAQGNFQWARQANGPGNERGKSIACDASGNVFVTGYYMDTCYFGSQMLVSPGLDNVFLAKYDGSGNLLWVLDGGSSSETWASTVGVNSYGDAWITGSFEGTAIFGSQTISSYGGNDVFLVKASSNGNWVTAVHSGGSADDFGNGLYVDGFDQIALTGSFFLTMSLPPAASITSNGDKDGFSAYYDPSGNCLWARNYGGPASDKGIDISVDELGFIYSTGFVSGTAIFDSISKTSAGGDDIFISKYTPQGNILYVELAGGTSQDYGKGIAVAGAGEVFVGGVFQGSISFGSLPLLSLGDRDAFLARYGDNSPEIVTQPQGANVCLNLPFTLSVSASGATPYTYQWFDQSGSISGATNSSYTFTPTNTAWSGNYYCVVSNPSGSISSNAAYVGVYDYPEPSLGPDQTILNTESIILDAGSIYYSYSWSTGASSQIITVNGATLGAGVFPYSVTVTNVAGCEGSDTVLVAVIIDGLEELEDLYGLKVYPNPIKEHLNILPGSFALQQVKLLDLSGRVCYSKVVQPQQIIQIPGAGLSPGVYFLAMMNSEGEEVYVKVIKP